MSVMSASHMNPSMAPSHVVIGLHVGKGEGVLMRLNSCHVAVTSCLQTELEVGQVYFFI